MRAGRSLLRAVYAAGGPGCDAAITPSEKKTTAMMASWTRNPIRQTTIARPVPL
jgi:hypothetical protein